jgi:hypothetical protein
MHKMGKSKERVVDELHRAQAAYYQALRHLLEDPKSRTTPQVQWLCVEVNNMIKRNSDLLSTIETFFQ